MARRKSSRPRSLEALLRDTRLIEAALRRAVREALLDHKRAGNPVPVGRDGRVVWIAPEDIEVDPADGARRRAKPARAFSRKHPHPTLRRTKRGGE
jgi:hypothetical protein